MSSEKYDRNVPICLKFSVARTVQSEIGLDYVGCHAEHCLLMFI